MDGLSLFLAGVVIGLVIALVLAGGRGGRSTTHHYYD